ncbi:MAG: TRAP transporter small permease [Lachnospiraceae bacterium]|nr:TRAP transporter small permease [Lachnospiraceae bacterium]MCD8249097.1 TRAP transporter small permease [Lachnospiraceae bacterium]
MKKVLDGFSKIIEILLVILMVAMVIVVFLATVGRYSHLYSIAWSEEFSRYCMVAIVYLGLMLASRSDSHFVVDVIPLIFRKKPTVVKVFSLIDALAVDIFAVFLAYEGWVVSSKMISQGKVSPMLKLPLGAVYLLVPIGIVLMAIYYTACKVGKLKDIGAEGKEAE